MTARDERDQVINDLRGKTTNDSDAVDTIADIILSVPINNQDTLNSPHTQVIVDAKTLEAARLLNGQQVTTHNSVISFEGSQIGELTIGNITVNNSLELVLKYSNPTLTQGTRRHFNILVTGGRDAPPDVCSIAQAIGKKVIERGHVLLTGGARGVDKCAAEGAYAYLLEYSGNDKERIVTFLPLGERAEFSFGQTVHVAVERRQRRVKVVETSHAVIILGGLKGTRHIFQTATDQNKPILPIGQTGGVAAEKWEVVSGDLRRYYGNDVDLLDFYRIKGEGVTPDEIAGLAVQFIERIASNKT